MANVTITQLPTAGTLAGTESVPIVQNGVTVQTTTGAIAGAPFQGQTFITVNQESSLANSQALTSGNGIQVTAGVPQGNITVALVASPTVSGTLTANTMVAGTFNGAGTGLTGTAAALSVGGNAATATTVPVRTTVLADGRTITVNVNTTDLAVQTNTQSSGTLTVAAPTGTPVNGQKFILRLQCSSGQVFSWNAVFAGSTDLALPTSTTGASKYDYVGFIYNTPVGKWQLLAKVFGF
jgi:hypothetical protein